MGGGIARLIIFVLPILLVGCPETTPPSVPTGLVTTNVTCTQVSLRWNASTDTGGSGLQSYRLFRDGTVVQQVTAPATSAVDAVTGGTTYRYTVAAVDGANNQSAQSAALTVVVPTCADTAAPSVPGGVTATASSCSQIGVGWNASTDTGGSGLKQYELYRAGNFLKAVTATSTTDTGLSPATAYSYTVRAVDNAGNRSAASAAAAVTTPTCGGQPPVANAGPDQMTQTLTTLTFNGNGSSDPDGTITSYAWTFGDGGTASGVSVTHAYATAGNYTATLTVTDSSGLSRNDTAAVSVANRPPVANAGPDATTPPNVALGFNAGASSDADGSITALAWDFGDGTTGAGMSVSHAYATAGSYTARLTVTDNLGAQGSDTRTVTVAAGGAHLWSRAFGGPTVGDSVAVQAVAVAPDGNLVVTGSFSGVVNFGGGNLTSAGGNDIFVAEYAGTNGNHLWSRRYGSTFHDFGAGVAVDQAGNVLVTGGFGATVDFGGGGLVSAGNQDVFVLKLTASGTHVWSKRYGGSNAESGTAIAVGATGDVAVAGTFTGAIDVGGGSLAGPGGLDLFVAQYAGGTGAHLWSRPAGGSATDKATGIAIDGSGRVLVVGTFTGSAGLGGSTLTSGGGLDVFVAQYGATGTHLWSKRFGGAGDDYGNAVKTDGTGNVVLTGQFGTNIDFGGGALANTGGPDIFLAKLSASGAHVWSRQYGNASNYQQTADKLAVDTAGNVVLSGNIIDAVDFGGGALPISGGGWDPYVVKLSASGSHLWSKRFGSPQAAYNYDGGVAIDAAGNALLAGMFSGSFSLGGSTFQNAGSLVNYSYDGFVAKFGP